MKAKIVILTPVYNDWKNLTKLLTKINNIFKYQIKKKFDLIVVNDCSSKDFGCKKLKLKNVNKLTLISLSKNVGSQRALAIGIKYINKIYKKNYKTIIIDSDGQDNPKAIIEMVKRIKKNPEFSVVANRGQRKESLIPYIINCTNNKKIIEIKTPFFKNDFIYVGDIINVISKSFYVNFKSGIYNLGSGIGTETKKIIEIIEKIKKIKINFNLNKNSKTKKFVASMNKTKKTFEYYKFVNIKTGLKKTLLKI